MRADAPNPTHFEIFSVDRVYGWEKGTLTEREYKPFFSYDHVPTGHDAGARQAGSSKSAEYHQIRLRPATVGSGTETYISFATESESGIMPSTETVAADLTCTCRNLPSKLNPGDIKLATGGSPAFATFRNITRVTQAASPPLEGRLLWHLISNMSLNYLSLASVESLRALLAVYNFHSYTDRQAARANQLRMEGIDAVRAVPDDMLHHGSTYRGVAITLDLLDDRFAGEGEMYLFASVLNHFFNLYATLNAYTRLTIRGRQTGVIYSWPPMLGQRPLV